jgi:hypothetical protein
MALILRVGGVTEALLEDVSRVVQRSHQRRVIRDVEHVEPIPVARRIHDRVDRLVIRHLVALSPNTDRTASATIVLGLGRGITQRDQRRSSARRIASRTRRRLRAVAETSSPGTIPRDRTSPTLSKKFGSHSLTSRTISEMTTCASCGVSPCSPSAADDAERCPRPCAPWR